MIKERIFQPLNLVLLFMLAACQTQTTPAAIPPTATPTTIPVRQTPTVKPLGEHVIAEWKINNPSGVYFGFNSVWVPGHHDLTTTRIDPATNSIIAVIKGTGDHAEQALAVGDVMWSQVNATTRLGLIPKRMLLL